jgi:putative membrane protein
LGAVLEKECLVEVRNQALCSFAVEALMDRSAMRTIGLAAVTALITFFVARADAGAANEASGTVATDTAARDSQVTVHWLNDANILAIYALMNQRQIAAASAELQAWRSDTVRALASTIAQEHSALQHSADSLTAALRIAPIPPAVSDSIAASLQSSVDSLGAVRGGSLDRAFVQQQVIAQQRISSYLQQLSTLAARPEVQAQLDAASARVSAELARTRSVQASFAIADSLVADSLAKRAARRNRKPTDR